MRGLLRHRPSYASVVATIALFVALGGGAYALGLKRNAVRSKNIAPGAVKTSDLAKKAVKGAKVAPDAIGGAQVNEATLGMVPNADLLDGIDSAALLRGSGREYTVPLADTTDGSGSASVPLDIGGTLTFNCRNPASVPSEFTFANGTGATAEVWTDKVQEGFPPATTISHSTVPPGGTALLSVSGPVVSSGSALLRMTIAAAGRLTTIDARIAFSGAGCLAPVAVTELRP